MCLFYVGEVVFVAVLFAALLWAAGPRHRKRNAFQLLLTWTLLALFAVRRCRR